MPTPPRRIRSSSHQPTLTRARVARTSGDMLTGGWDPAAGVDPGSQPPAVWWWGSDGGGQGLSGGPIGPHGPFPTGYAGALAVVTRATSLICGPLSAAPFRVQELGFGGRPMTRPRWVTDPCLTRPDSRYPADVFADAQKQTRGNFFFSWVRDAIHHGTGAFLAQLDEAGQPLAGSLKLINPYLLSTERADDGSLRWVLGSESATPEDKVVFGRDGTITLGTIRYRLIALRNPHGATDVEGHTPGVFEAHPDAFRLGTSIESYAQGTFRAGIPAGFLKVDSTMNSMTQEQANELKRNWMAAHGGDRRSIAVLNSFTDFKPLNLSPVDSALSEVKRLSIADVAFAFGLSPETLGVSLSGSATYGNVMAYFEFHRDFGLAPWIAAVEDTLTALLPGTTGIKVNLDDFANPPMKERFDAYKVAIDSGVLTPNEARELEGLEPLPEPEQFQQEPEPEELEEPESAAVRSIRSRRPQPWR